jgi:DNA-binding NarL/FixJ family response regulator
VRLSERAAANHITGRGRSTIRSTAADVIPVSIVSNSCLLRDGLARLLTPHAQLNIFARYPGQPITTSSWPNPVGHQVLLDATVGQQQSINWIRALRQLSPPAHVVVLELADDCDCILACIEAGATAYLPLGASVQDVVQAIQDAHMDRARCSPEITALLFNRLAANTASACPPVDVLMPLTARELEVLHDIALDYTNVQIARHLVIELSTVKHHIHSILEKLQLSHRWAAVQMAQERGWLTAGGTTARPKD